MLIATAKILISRLSPSSQTRDPLLFPSFWDSYTSSSSCSRQGTSSEQRGMPQRGAKGRSRRSTMVALLESTIRTGQFTLSSIHQTLSIGWMKIAETLPLIRDLLSGRSFSSPAKRWPMHPRRQTTTSSLLPLLSHSVKRHFRSVDKHAMGASRF